MRFLAEELLHLLLNQWHSSLPANQNYPINLGWGLFGIGQCLAAGLQTLLHQVHYQLL